MQRIKKELVLALGIAGTMLCLPLHETHAMPIKNPPIKELSYAKMIPLSDSSKKVLKPLTIKEYQLGIKKVRVKKGYVVAQGHRVNYSARVLDFDWQDLSIKKGKVYKGKSLYTGELTYRLGLDDTPHKLKVMKGLIVI